MLNVLLTLPISLFLFSKTSYWISWKFWRQWWESFFLYSNRLAYNRKSKNRPEEKTLVWLLLGVRLVKHFANSVLMIMLPFWHVSLAYSIYRHPQFCSHSQLSIFLFFFTVRRIKIQIMEPHFSPGYLCHPIKTNHHFLKAADRVSFCPLSSL